LGEKVRILTPITESEKFNTTFLFGADLPANVSEPHCSTSSLSYSSFWQSIRNLCIIDDGDILERNFFPILVHISSGTSTSLFRLFLFPLAFASRINLWNQATMASSSALQSHRWEGKRIWYRTTLFNAFVIGSVGFLAPGLWNAMSSLGAGGEETLFLVNAANALVFGLSKSYRPF
jgi:hypothetical protein